MLCVEMGRQYWEELELKEWLRGREQSEPQFLIERDRLLKQKMIGIWEDPP